MLLLLQRKLGRRRHGALGLFALLIGRLGTGRLGGHTLGRLVSLVLLGEGVRTMATSLLAQLESHDKVMLVVVVDEEVKIAKSNSKQ